MRLSMKVSTCIALFFCLLLCCLVQAHEAGLVWSTFLGGSDYDLGYDIAIDIHGNVYLTGVITSPDFPTAAGAADTIHGGRDILVVKLSAAGDSLAYVALLGGSGDDEGKGLVVDSEGCVYVAGVTNSADFPTTPWAYDTVHNGSRDIVVVKLDPLGADLEYGTFVGGSGSDWGNGLAVDDQGNALVAGHTDSENFPTTPGAFDTSFNGGYWDAVVIKLDQQGGQLEYATYLGGSDADNGQDVDVDSEGHLYIAGNTSSDDFPVTGAVYDPTPNGGTDVFVVKLNPSGEPPAYATYLGGSLADHVHGMVVDASGRVLVVGKTVSSDFPVTPGAYDITHNSPSAADAFVARLDQEGENLEFSTFLGGNAPDEGHGIILDAGGDVYLSGWTHSLDFPSTSGSFCPDHSGQYSDAFLVRLDSAGSALTYGTFLGGSGIDLGWALTADGDGFVYLTGETKSADFPTTPGAFCDTITGNYADIFVAKLQLEGTPVAWEAPSSGLPESYGLLRSWPNPFNASTQIRYRVPRDGHITLKIYNAVGQQMCRLVDEDLAAGEYTVFWKGSSDVGHAVSSGVYFCRIETADANGSLKMLLLR